VRGTVVILLTSGRCICAVQLPVGEAEVALWIATVCVLCVLRAGGGGGGGARATKVHQDTRKAGRGGGVARVWVLGWFCVLPGRWTADAEPTQRMTPKGGNW
jgi:hypothetical protein